VVAKLAQTVLGEMLNVLIVGFFGTAVKVLVETLIRIAIIGLRILLFPGCNFLLVDPNGAVLDPGLEVVELFLRVVRADPGRVAVVPACSSSGQRMTTRSTLATRA